MISSVMMALPLECTCLGLITTVLWKRTDNRNGLRHTLQVRRRMPTHGDDRTDNRNGIGH